MSAFIYLLLLHWFSSSYFWSFVCLYTIQAH